MLTIRQCSNHFSQGLLLWLVSMLCLAADLNGAKNTGTQNASLDDIAAAKPGGEQLMQQVYARHQQFPYIYEEQSLVMEDRHGHRDTRRAKRYTRVEPDGTVKFLLLFDFPEEIRGVAVLAQRYPDGRSTHHVYLPALGETLKETVAGNGASNFLGTDFSVENLTGEDLSQYRYVRREDKTIDEIPFYLVDVFDKSNDSSETTNLPQKALRRHFIRQDNLYITLTHHYGRLGRVSRIQSWHDLRPVAGNMWRADMILMMDKKEQHQSLLKVSRRIYSKDYVPEEVFSAAWLFQQFPYIAPQNDGLQNNELLEQESLDPQIVSMLQQRALQHRTMQQRGEQ